MFQVVEPTYFMENKRVLECVYWAIRVKVSGVVSMSIGS